MRQINDLHRVKLKLMHDPTKTINYKSGHVVHTYNYYFVKFIELHNTFHKELHEYVHYLLSKYSEDIKTFDTITNDFMYYTELAKFYSEFGRQRRDLEKYYQIVQNISKEQKYPKFMEPFNHLKEQLDEMYYTLYWSIVILTRSHEVYEHIESGRAYMVLPLIHSILTTTTSLVEDIIGEAMYEQFDNDNILRNGNIYFSGVLDELSDQNYFDDIFEEYFPEEFERTIRDRTKLNKYRNDFSHEISRRHNHTSQEFIEIVTLCTELVVLVILSTDIEHTKREMNKNPTSITEYTKMLLDGELTQ